MDVLLSAPDTFPDRFFLWQLKIAQRADEIARSGQCDGGRARENWDQAEVEILGLKVGARAANEEPMFTARINSTHTTVSSHETSRLQ